MEIYKVTSENSISISSISVSISISISIRLDGDNDTETPESVQAHVPSCPRIKYLIMGYPLTLIIVWSWVVLIGGL